MSFEFAKYFLYNLFSIIPLHENKITCELKQLVATDAFGKGSPTREEVEKAMHFERGFVIDIVNQSVRGPAGNIIHIRGLK